MNALEIFWNKYEEPDQGLMKILGGGGAETRIFCLFWQNF